MYVWGGLQIKDMEYWESLSGETMWRIIRNCTQTRSFCYVTDQVEGLLKLAFSERAEGEVVNIDELQKIAEW